MKPNANSNNDIVQKKVKPTAKSNNAINHKKGKDEGFIDSSEEDKNTSSPDELPDESTIDIVPEKMKPSAKSNSPNIWKKRTIVFF